MKKIIITSIFLIAFLFIGRAQILYKGDKAPDFELTPLKGEKVTLKDYENKVVVIKMWYTTCDLCVDEISKLNTLVQNFKLRNDLVFIAPSPNSKRTLKKFNKKTDFHYTTMYAAFEMLRKYNPFKRYPSHILIDKQGKIAFVLEGSLENIDEILTAEIKKLL